MAGKPKGHGQGDTTLLPMPESIPPIKINVKEEAAMLLKYAAVIFMFALFYAVFKWVIAAIRGTAKKR